MKVASSCCSRGGGHWLCQLAMNPICGVLQDTAHLASAFHVLEVVFFKG